MGLALARHLLVITFVLMSAQCAVHTFVFSEPFIRIAPVAAQPTNTTVNWGKGAPTRAGGLQLGPGAV